MRRTASAVRGWFAFVRWHSIIPAISPAETHAPSSRPPAAAWPRLLIALLALVAIAFSVFRLESAADGLDIRRERVGDMPATVFRPGGAPAAAPVVLIAHGFAGSQQLMQPFATTLARNGFVVVTFDFPGHGRHGAPMRGGLADQEESLRVFLAAMDTMGVFARGLAADGRYAVLGHSMASDIVVRHAQAHADVVTATVGVSLFAPSITADTPADRPRNLLVVVGALEPALLMNEALRVAGRVAGPQVEAGRTYGDFTAGTARRVMAAPGVEHIGVLYSGTTQAESLAWMQQAFGRPASAAPFLDVRGPALGLLLLGVLGLAWPLASLLPRVGASAPSQTPPVIRERWWSWRGSAPLVIVPALATPLILWPLPTSFLPILLGDYLVLHFGLYGLLTLGMLVWSGRRWPVLAPGRRVALLVAIVAATMWAVLAIGLPLDRYVFNVEPPPVRLPLIAAMWLGTLPYFIADEWLTRDPAAARGAYLVTKFCFLLSLLLAIALNPWKLFFLAIIVPAVLLMFIVYGLFSRWIFRATIHPLVAAIANALAFGFLIAVTFPLVG